jgi:hypothetical protein
MSSSAVWWGLWQKRGRMGRGTWLQKVWTVHGNRISPICNGERREWYTRKIQTSSPFM